MTLNPGSTKELIILTENFSPSTGATAQLVTDLADDLYRSGISLRVLTATCGPSDHAYPVLRLSSSSSPSVGILKKVIHGFLFFTGTATWLLVNIQKHQSLLIVSNPPFIGLIGVLVSLIRRTRYVFLFQDVFPRSASLTGILPAHGPLILLWRSLLKLVLIRSQTTVVLSSSMIRRCKSEFGSDIQLEFIPNWAVFSPQSKAKLESQLAYSWDLQNTFTVQYSGNFGRLHEILIILEAARMLQAYPIMFVFVGGGAKADQIEKYRATYNLTNVIVKPYQPRALLADSLASCDISIVSLIPGADDTVAPSKLYGILASSKPVLLLSSEESEIASLITHNKCGLVVPHGDPVLLSKTLIYLSKTPDQVVKMGKNALILYKKNYGRAKSISQYHQLLVKYDMV
ncbi:glycosyltransferase family 4 protein [Synechococcus sp. W4D4]|uniref:glycosyltransferase family 4 protein n=1 Tax=Synechococcus sp. W4D4 TaxID=3392294 RepID=UPI0039E75242